MARVTFFLSPLGPTATCHLLIRPPSPTRTPFPYLQTATQVNQCTVQFTHTAPSKPKKSTYTSAAIILRAY